MVADILGLETDLGIQVIIVLEDMETEALDVLVVMAGIPILDVLVGIRILDVLVVMAGIPIQDDLAVLEILVLMIVLPDQVADMMIQVVGLVLADPVAADTVTWGGLTNLVVLVILVQAALIRAVEGSVTLILVVSAALGTINFKTPAFFGYAINF